MNRHLRRPQRLGRALALLLVLLALSPLAGSQLNLRAAQKTAHARLDGALQELLNRLGGNNGAAAAQAYGAVQGVEVTENQGKLRLPILFEASPAASPQALRQLRQDLEAQGATIKGKYKTLWSVENFPLGQAQSFSARPEAFYMSLPQSAVTLGEVDSEALLPLGALELQAQGVTGKGVKVAILDKGFVGLQNAIDAGELPADAVTRDFTDSGLEAGTNHGTAVAEVVHEIAPEAQLFLVRISDRRTFASAVKWAIAQDVNIINMSVGWFNLDFYDCQGLVSDLSTTARQAGVLWVNAAGNQAQTHYEAPFKDDDHDTFHDQTLELTVDTATTLTAFLTWDDWTIEDRFSDENFDLFLMQDVRQVAASTNIQSASDKASEPKETINKFLQPGTYSLKIQAVKVDNPHRLDLFVNPATVKLTPHTPQSSLPEPANCQDVFVVGAVNVADWEQGKPELFSAQGPTNAGLPKPDLVGPDGVSNASWGGAFFGTSASSPSVAGAAALLWSQDLKQTAQEVKQTLLERAQAIPNEPANVVGAGRLQLRARPNLPDLVVKSVEVTPQALEVGGSATVSVEVANEGTLGAESFFVSVETGTREQRVQLPGVEDQEVRKLDPGETIQLTFTLTVPQQDFPLLVTADRFDDVEEADEDNNTFTLALQAQLRPPALEVTPQSVTLQGVVERDEALSQALTISNSGGQPLEWRVSADQDWVELSQNGGTLAPGEKTQLTLSLKLAGLSAGAHEAKLTVVAPGASGSPVRVPVTLNVAPFSVCARDCPFSTLAAAVEAAGDGDILTVGPGSYDETLTITKSLTLQGAGPDQTTIQGVEPGLPVILVESDRPIEVTIQGLTIGGAISLSGEVAADPAKLCAEFSREPLVTKCPGGIQVSGQVSATIQGNTISDNADDGIDVLNGADATIMDNLISNNTNEGVLVRNGQAKILNNTIDQNNQIGIGVERTSNVEIEGNQITNTRQDANNQGGFGIDVQNSSTATIEDNTLDGNTGIGIVVFEQADATIQGNTIKNTQPNAEGKLGLGIIIDSASATIENNTIIANSDTGVGVGGQADVTIKGNTIQDTKPDGNGEFGRGITVRGSAKATIKDNTIKENAEWGIGLGGAVQATISNNTITANQKGGIFVGFTIDNETAQVEISRNTVQDNKDCGVLVDKDEPDIKVTGSGNLISGNDPDLCDEGNKLPQDFIDIASLSVLEAAPSTLSFDARLGESNPAAQTLTLHNRGGKSLSWTASSDATWLQLNKDSGSLDGGAEASVEVSVDLSGLSAGSQQATITIRSDGAQNSLVTVAVMLNVKQALPPSSLPPVSTFGFGSVNSVAFSPDGKYVAEGGGGSSVQLIDTDSWNVVRTFEGHTDKVLSVAFSPDRKLLASGSDDNTIKLWDVSTGKQVRTLSGHTDSVLSVAFSPDGKLLASGSSDDTIKLWDVSTGQEVRTLSGHTDSVLSVAFSPDGKLLASGSSDNTIKLWEARTGKEVRTLSGHIDSVLSVAFSPDGKLLASGSGDRTIKLWEARTGKEVRTLKDHNGDVNSVAFSPDGTLLASGSSDDTIKLWSVDTGEEVRTLSGHTDSVLSVASSPDGKLLVSGSSDDTIKLWSVDTGEEVRTLSGHNGWVRSVAFSPDGTLLASGSSDNTIKLWDVDTGKEVRTLKDHNGDVNSVAFSPDGTLLASGSSDETIKLWDVNTGEEVRTLSGHNGDVNSVAFSPDGTLLASGSSDDTIKLWNVDTGEEVRTLSGHTDSVLSVAFSPNGKLLASGSNDRTIKLWDVSTGQEVRTLSGGGRVAFSPDGKLLASGSRLWDVSTGQEVRTLSGGGRVAFSPDGALLASGSRDNTIKLWEVASQKVRTLTGPFGSFFLSVAFSPDGKLLASGFSDATIKLWLVPPARQVRTLSGHSNTVLSVAYSHDDQVLASASDDNSIKLWNVATGQNQRTLSGHNDTVFSVAFSPDDALLASSSADKTIKLWDAGTVQIVRTLSGHDDWVRTVAFSPDGKLLASGSDDWTVKLWNVATGQEVRTLSGHNDWVRSVAFSPDGKLLASASADKTIKLWNVDTGEEVRTFSGHGDEVRSVAFSPDGKLLASASADDTIKVWNVATGEKVRTLSGHTGDVESVAFSPDGKFLASGSDDNMIKLWNVSSGKNVLTFIGHLDAVFSVAFNADGTLLASGSADNTIKLWEVGDLGS